VYVELQNGSSARDLFFEKIPETVLVCYAAIIFKPNYPSFRCRFH